jgi:hypothetical protein
MSFSDTLPPRMRPQPPTPADPSEQSEQSDGDVFVPIRSPCRGGSPLRRERLGASMQNTRVPRTRANGSSDRGHMAVDVTLVGQIGAPADVRYPPSDDLALFHQTRARREQFTNGLVASVGTVKFLGSDTMSCARRDAQARNWS